MREVTAAIPIPDDPQEKSDFARDPDSHEKPRGGRREERSTRMVGKSYDDRLNDGYRLMGMGGDA